MLLFCMGLVQVQVLIAHGDCEVDCDKGLFKDSVAYRLGAKLRCSRAVACKGLFSSASTTAIHGDREAQFRQNQKISISLQAPIILNTSRTPEWSDIDLTMPNLWEMHLAEAGDPPVAMSLTMCYYRKTTMVYCCVKGGQVVHMHAGSTPGVPANMLMSTV
jgi:hypothetical protein